MKSFWIVAIILAWMGITPYTAGFSNDPPAHSSKTRQDGNPKVEKPTVEIPREGCVTAECHVEVKDYIFLHGPLQVNACDGCHSLTNAKEHTFKLFRPRDELCAFCHTLNLEDAKYLHKPMTKGDCLSCHNPHGGEEEALLKGESYADMCSNCHEEQWDAMDSVHGPVAAGACGACHEAHGSRFPKLLEKEGRDLCLQCHISTAASIDAAHYVHGPSEVECQVCHDPHASMHSMLLKEDPIELCESCHEDIRRKVEYALTKHAAVTTERACLNCHTAHDSDFPRMLRANPRTLCFECHNKEIKAADGSVLPNMKALIDSGKSLHGPTAQDSCVLCHEIHGGGHDRLLIKEYPSNLYYPFSKEVYSLCFSCHDRNLVLQAESTAVTNFRNGDSNLHFVHVKKEKRGRSCRICHNTHAGDQDHLIRNSVKYGPGGWVLQIGFVVTPTGGRCASGCHGTYAYDRVKPVENLIPKEPEDYKEHIIRNGGAKVETKSDQPQRKEENDGH